MSLPWWTGVPPAQTAIQCGENIHRLIWAEGALQAVDHADPEGERALAALGGEPLACITQLDAWRRHTHDLDVLLLGSRGAADVVTQGDTGPARPVPGRLGAWRPAPAPGVRGGGVNVALVFSSGSSSSPGPAGLSDEEQLARLLAIGGGLSRRLEATVAAHWRERLRDADAETERVRARLHAALYGRVLATLGAWLGRTDVALALELVPEGSAVGLNQEADGSYLVTLPFGWLVDVWGRGLEVFWGRFCLAATSTDGRSWELATVGPDLGPPAPLTLALPG